MILPGLLFALRLLSADGWGQIFPKWLPPEEGTLLNISESFASNVLPPQQATFTPVFPGGPPRTAVRFDPDSYGAFALPWDPVHMKVCVCLSRMGISVSSSPLELLHTSPTGLQCQMFRGFFFPVQIPSRGDLTWGPELSLL